MGDLKARIRVPSRGVTSTVPGLLAGENYLPCKEWSLVDDMLTVADSLSVTIANPDGTYTGKVRLGDRIEFDESDSEVSNGVWTRHFTGRITSIDYRSDASSGSTILISAMDLGWHLTSCDAPPLFKTNGITIDRLLRGLIDPSWGFASTGTSGPDVTDNVLNRRLKQGRAGVARAFVPPKTILPFIQVEPGQKPWGILEEYLKREGLLLNVSAKGGLILFRPDYSTDTPYTGVIYHADEARLGRNTTVGRTSVSEKIDGVYSRTECWSTAVVPTNVQATEIANNPNAQYRKAAFTPDSNPLPFSRLHVDMDGEAINEDMRKMRARWRWQMDAFNSWQYEAELKGHSQRGAFIVSDTMMPINDSVHQVEGTYYVQRVQRSMSPSEGARTKVLLRKPLLDPGLTRQTGAGARRATQ